MYGVNISALCHIKYIKGFLLNGNSVKTGDDRPCRIGCPYCVGKSTTPHICFVRIVKTVGFGKSITFISQIPSDYGTLFSHSFYKIVNKTQLPFYCGWVFYEIFSFKCGRSEIAKTHMTGYKTNNELDFVFFGYGTKFFKTLTGFFAYTGASGLSVWKRRVLKGVFNDLVIGH